MAANSREGDRRKMTAKCGQGDWQKVASAMVVVFLEEEVPS